MIPKEKKCTYCHTEFKPKSWNQKACSTACADKINQSRGKRYETKRRPKTRDTSIYGSGYDV